MSLRAPSALLRLALAAAVFAGLLTAPGRASACICRGPESSFDEMSLLSPLIVVGDVESVQASSTEADKIELTVVETLRGKAAPQRIVAWGSNGQNCRPSVKPFEARGRWVVLLWEDRGEYLLGNCGPSYLQLSSLSQADAEAQLARLREIGRWAAAAPPELLATWRAADPSKQARIVEASAGRQEPGMIAFWRAVLANPGQADAESIGRGLSASASEGALVELSYDLGQSTTYDEALLGALFQHPVAGAFPALQKRFLDKTAPEATREKALLALTRLAPDETVLRTALQDPSRALRFHALGHLSEAPLAALTELAAAQLESPERDLPERASSALVSMLSRKAPERERTARTLVEYFRREGTNGASLELLNETAEVAERIGDYANAERLFRAALASKLPSSYTLDQQRARSTARLAVLLFMTRRRAQALPLARALTRMPEPCSIEWGTSWQPDASSVSMISAPMLGRSLLEEMQGPLYLTAKRQGRMVTLTATNVSGKPVRLTASVGQNGGWWVSERITARSAKGAQEILFKARDATQRTLAAGAKVTLTIEAPEIENLPTLSIETWAGGPKPGSKPDDWSQPLRATLMP